MRKSYRLLVFLTSIALQLFGIGLLSIILEFSLLELFSDWSFLLLLPFILLCVEEVYVWAKNGKRSDFSEFIFILYCFFLIFFVTKDFLTSLMGAFSLYLWVGVWELRHYPVINKILMISLITYTVVFIMGIISFYLDDAFFLNTALAFSFWIILILGFLFFGRKYLIVWRFMSPQYLTLFLYIIGWLVVVFINQYTPINFLDYIYLVLIFVNIFIYFTSGIFLDKLLGIKRVKDKKINEIVNNVKRDINIKGKIKTGFGEYPILNAMAYGPIFDRRIAIIAEDINNIPKDELRGIVAHELAHIKGNHTLILALITIGDLVVRMFLGIPATMYDYTFGDPQLPLIYFILINIGIYVILYFFVRILEGFADLKAKRSGYEIELAKALYNLESFYATGREIGLNTMLLCEEKITNENQMLDYMETAKYLNNSMINPSRFSLLSNFLNSHPLTFHRLATILDKKNSIKPAKEALLPLLCLRRSKQRKYANVFLDARQKIQQIATKKFKEHFQIDDITLFLEEINRKERYKMDFGEAFLFQHLISKEIIIGTLMDIQFNDNICEPESYVVQVFKNGEIKALETSLYSKKRICFENTYILNNQRLMLKDIELLDSNTKAHYIFSDIHGNIEKKAVNKTKLTYPLEFIESFEDHEIFLKQKGEIDILKCRSITSDQNNKIIITLDSNSALDPNDNPHLVTIDLDEIIIFPYRVQFSITNKTKLKKSARILLEWIYKTNQRTYFYLKKPVNNIEVGYIKEIINTSINSSLKKHSFEELNNMIKIKILTIFKEIKEIEVSQIDMISFKYKTGMIQKREELSIFTKLFYKLLKKLNQESIIFQ
ncbi:MAG: Protease HtpX [Promethearchaeota archaeon]|nr:MAG: Protease HtpX [Candidatus Lokiarchaeota archaeon]